MRKTILVAFLVLCGVGILAMAPGPPRTWTWSVAVNGTAPDVNLVGDNGSYQTIKDADHYDVNVKVVKQTKNSYLFRLHIWNDSGRRLSFPGVQLDPESVYFEPAYGPGYFPVSETVCTVPDPRFCTNDAGCSARLQTFLALSHPVSCYASVRLEITVPLNIEGLRVTEQPLLANAGVRLYIEKSGAILNGPLGDFHNMDALNLATSPVWIQRTGADTWKLWVDSPDPYLNYGEFYFGIFRGSRWENKISMTVDGSFKFDTTWTRE